MKEIYLQIKYIIGRPSWWIGTLISFIAMMQGFISEGIYQSKNLIYMMTVAMNYGVFIPLAPLAAVISVGGHLESAITNACCYPHMIRCRKRQFVFYTGFSTAIAGGLALIAGWIISMGALKFLWHLPTTGENMLGLEQTSLGSWIAAGNPWAYLIARAILVFLYGLFCVCVSMPIAFGRQESATICLFPFSFLRIMQYMFFGICPAFLSPTRILLGMDIMKINAKETFIVSFLSINVMSFFLLLISLKIFERRLSFE